jgi:hypothetical protein
MAIFRTQSLWLAKSAAASMVLSVVNLISIDFLSWFHFSYREFNFAAEEEHLLWGETLPLRVDILK